MFAYSTLSEAVNDLQRRGYTDDLTAGGHCLVCNTRGLSLDPAQFEIDEFHRFEGMSDPGDESVLFAVSAECGHKGTLTATYGPEMSSEEANAVFSPATARTPTP